MARALPSSDRTRRPPARRLSRAQRREAILQGATRAFSAAGFAATSMSDVAAAAGITPLIVYRHFDSKEALYRAALEAASERMEAELATGGEPDGYGVGAGSVLRAARQDPAGFRLLWRHAAREPQFASYAERLREQAIERAEAALRERVPREALRWAAHAVVGYLVESVLNWLEFGDSAHDERFVAATNAAMRAGIRVWSQAERTR
ncbi:MAG: TetR/AcrR family transcriptional regulator [Myxococcota bacterium]